MSKKTKRFLSILMTFIMIMVSVPIPELKVHAAGSGIWIGNTELAEGKAYCGDVGEARLSKEGGKYVLTFDDFEFGSDADDVNDNGTTKTLIRAKNSVTLKGKAKITASGENVSAIVVESHTITIDKDAELSLSSEGYTMYQFGASDLQVYGSLESVTTAANFRDAIHIDEVYLYDGCNVKAAANGSWGNAIHASKLFVKGGNVTAEANGDNGDAMFATNMIEISGGVINASATGKEGCAIGDYAYNIDIKGGDITATGGKYAIHALTAITIDPAMYFKEPAGAVVSSDKTDIVYAGEIATSVHLVKPVNYDVTVGGYVVNSENKDDIPGILGGGKASFDPDTRTLTFTGEVTGLDGMRDVSGIKCLISSDTNLTINGDATLENSAAATAINVYGANAVLTINDKLSLESSSDVLRVSQGTININGDVTALCTGLGNAVYGNNINIDGNLATGTGNPDYFAIKADKKLVFNSGKVVVDYINETDPSSSDMAAVKCLGDIEINGGNITVDVPGEKVAGIFADGENIIMNGGTVTVFVGGTGTAAMLASKDIKLLGGTLDVTSKKGRGLIAKNITVENATVSLMAYKCAISASDKFRMESGVLEAESDAVAIQAVNELSYNTEAVNLSEPAGGSVQKDGTYYVIKDSENNTAKKVKLDGSIVYPLWVGSTQVTEENKDDIPGVIGGKASYNELTKTLTFTGDVTGVTGAYEAGGMSIMIMSMDNLGLTIEGNASIKDEDMTTAIGAVKKLTINGNIEACAELTVLCRDLVVNGKLTVDTAPGGMAITTTGDITINGEGLFAKSSVITDPAIQVDGKFKLISGVFESEGKLKAVHADGGIEIPAGYEITVPEGGELSSDKRTIVENGTTTPAKKVRIEKVDKYDLWVGNKQVTSLNKDDIPDILGGGKASYDNTTKTLTFTGEVTGVKDLDAATKNAVIYSKDELTVAGDITSDTSLNPDSYGIYSEGKLTIKGNVDIQADKGGIYVDDADLVVEGNVVTAAEKNAVTAKNITIDAGSLSANAADVFSKAISVTGNVEVKPYGSLTAINSGNDSADAMVIGGKLELNGGTVLAKKSNEKGCGISAVEGIYVTSGRMDIICDKGSSDGIKDSYLSIKGGEVNIQVKGFGSSCINNAGVNIQIEGGSLNAVSQLTRAIICGKFVMFDGDVNAEAGNTAIDAGMFMMESGRLTAFNTAESGTPVAIKSAMAIDLGPEVAITEPANGKLSDDKLSFVDAEGNTANKVRLSTPLKYKVWVGATQVTDENQDDIPGVTGGKASYDPVSRTLSFTGDVTGVTGLSTDKSQIYATENITITGKANLENEEAEYGIHVLGYGVNVRGDLNVLAETSAVRTEGDISISGNVVAKSGISSEATLQTALDSKIILEAGSVDAEKTGTAGYGAISAKDLVIKSGVLKAKSATGKAIEVAGSITIPASYEVSEPEGGKISADGKSIVDATDAPAGSVTIERKKDLPPELESIAVTTPPAKTKYKTGQSFNPAGMVITATYSDSSTKAVTGYTWSPDGALSVCGTVTVTISYTEVGITKTTTQDITVSEETVPVVEEDDVWNLFTKKSYSFEINGLSAGTEVVNSNAKSAKFYDAKINGSTITVSLLDNADRKKAAKPANASLEFKLDDGSVVSYVMPVQYVKPVFKLSTASVTIKSGALTEVKTQLLYKTRGGNFEPYDLSTAAVKYGSIAAAGDNDGFISFNAQSSMSGTKLTIKEEDWENEIGLKFSVKGVDKDVLSVDLGGTKTVILNTNEPLHKYTFDLKLNGANVAPEALTVSCKKAEGIASVNPAGKLEIALPATAPKAGNYTVSLAAGKAKASVKVKVSEKPVNEAVALKIQSKYDVVTGQKMVVVPVYKDAGMEILEVSSDTANITAELNNAGNIEIGYTGDALDAKRLKMGDIKLNLKLDGVTDPVSITLNNVKAKKSMPKVKASVVNISATAAGEIKGSVNIISTYKDGSGKYHLIAPVSVEIVSQKKATAEKNAADMTEIDIKSIDAKSGSIKVKLTYPGGVTKNVTIKLKKK